MRARIGLLVLLVAAFSPATASALAGGASAPTREGGVAYGSPLKRVDRKPVASVFRVTPRTVTEGRLPRIELRIDQRGVRTVTARVAFVPLKKGRGKTVNLKLGAVRTGKLLRPAWPEGTTLPAGRYVARVHAVAPGGATLRRQAKASGRTTITVKPAPKPKPEPTPAPPAIDPGVSPLGVFPVAGPYRLSGADGSFGASRGNHSHEGHDIAADEGTPVVAPLAGTIVKTGYQASGAGYYVVMDAVDGRSFFFAHCQKGSIAVKGGQGVSAGQLLCRVGSTGSATGPHLHFEIWVGGWRRDKNSRPVDPLPQLLAWAR